ncbi:Glutamate receptor ionotropic, NMDA 2D [Folsomia candida]|uniref:Glutamate receptor ionotropic, NMDA 2D n=1 Tax=Folsomia candida TaxID=158441 RepID=A0A226D2E3_FOLCA|nr:Glutamate receptor ionotropic, NMDA 2D [Folsomia candida]
MGRVPGVTRTQTRPGRGPEFRNGPGPETRVFLSNITFNAGASKYPPPYFDHILTNNPNTAIVLNPVYANLTLSILDMAANPLTNIRRKSGWASVSFLPSVPGDSKRKYFMMQRKIVYIFNPTFIFQHTDNPWDSSSYQDYSYHNGISKLILFNVNYPDDIFIPCIPCLYSVRIKLRSTPLPKMESVWWTKNINLLQKKVLYNKRVNVKHINCEVYHVRQMSSKDCKIVHLSQSLNFSIAGVPHTFEVYVSMLGTDTYNAKHGFMMPYSVKYNSVQFSIITQYPSGLESMAAFLQPFSPPVWGVLLLGCMTICLVVQVTKEDMTLIEVTFDMINIVALLLGQGDSSRICHNRRTIAAPIVAVWLLCGCYVIMENLYTGEIFSYLSAIKPPHVPETLSQLVDSDIPIITTSSYLGYGSSGSILTSNTIPQYIKFYQDRNKSVELLVKLKRRLTFVHAVGSIPNVVEFLSSTLASKSLAHFNTSIDPRQTYAIMDDHHIFEPTSTLLRINGSRSVLNGKDATPFVSLWCDLRFRNWLSPLLDRKLGQLEVSGMAGRWDELQRVTNVQLILRLIRDPAYKRYSKGFRPNRESAKEVPIQLKAKLSNS